MQVGIDKIPYFYMIITDLRFEWDTKKNSMNKKTPKYTDEPMEVGETVKDFLPSPEELGFTPQTVKVTITLSKRSTDFFKRQAKKQGTQYQKMIRRLLDAYVEKHS